VCTLANVHLIFVSQNRYVLKYIIQIVVRELFFGLHTLTNNVFHVSTGNKAKLVFDLNQFTTTKDTVDAISNIQYLNENTNTTGGLHLARKMISNYENGARYNLPSVIVLITDGQPTTGAGMLPTEVTIIKTLNIRIVCIGISKEVGVQLQCFYRSFKLLKERIGAYLIFSGC